MHELLKIVLAILAGWLVLSITCCGVGAQYGPDRRLDPAVTKAAGIWGFLVGGMAIVVATCLPFLAEAAHTPSFLATFLGIGALVSPFLGGIVSYKVAQRLAWKRQESIWGFSLRAAIIATTIVALLVATGAALYRRS